MAAKPYTGFEEGNAICADMGSNSWGYAIRFALGWLLMPGLILLSRLLKKPIKI